MEAISTGGFILVSDYVRMEVTLVGASWDVVAGDQTGVDFIPMNKKVSLRGRTKVAIK